MPNKQCATLTLGSLANFLVRFLELVIILRLQVSVEVDNERLVLPVPSTQKTEEALESSENREKEIARN